MAKLSLNHIYKTYPNGLKAVNDFNFEIKDGEFVVFVGPSGCGKSTTLRMIAGLEEITAGGLYIDDKLVNYVEPKNRDIAMVFQNYALYPHLNVFENIAFGLKLRHTPKEEIEKKVHAAAEMLGLTDYLNKKPAAMSGGQRQRVALGRALVREPKVFLLDEPLSNLDAKLRVSMRSEITKLHNKLGTTFIYVTHDQVEAMTMGDRIVVMKLGYVQQIDTPKSLYRYPVNKFVASFIGTPQMSFTNAHLSKTDKGVVLSFDDTDVSFVLPFDYIMKVDPIYFDNCHSLSFAIRSEYISIDKDKFNYSSPVKIAHVEELGTEIQVFANFDTKKDVLFLNGNDDEEANKTNIVLKTDADYQGKIGDIINISMDLAYLHLFDNETEEVINPRVPDHARLNCKVKNNVCEMFGLKIELPSAIKLEDDDDYQVYIPSKALNINEDGFDFKVYSCEKVDDKYLLILRNKDEVLFLLSDVEKKKDEKIKVSFDLKYLSFYKKDKKVLNEMKDTNEIVGMVYYHKEKDPTTGKKVKVLDYLINDLTISVRNNKIAYRVFIEDNDHSLYDLDFGFRFKPDQIKICDDGELELKPIEIIDYGKEKYLKCSFENTEIIILVQDADIDFSKNIRATIDFDKVEVFDIKKDIRFA